MVTFVGTDPITPFENLLNTLDSARATDIAARQIKSWKWANTAARTAQTGMSEGDMGDQLDTNVVYRYSGAAWEIVTSPVTVGTVVPVTGYTNAVSNLLTKQGSMVTYNMSIVKNTGTLTSSTQIATLPVGFRPTVEVNVAVAYNNASVGWASIATNGVVTIYFLGTAATQVYMSATFVGA